MFSASSHARLFELYNRETWPLHIAMLGLGLLLLAAASAPASKAAKWAPFALAAAWGWVGWGFLWTRFGEINTAARYLAPAFAAQAVLLVVAARGQLGSGRAWRRTGITCIGAAMLLWPLLAPLSGRTWPQAEFFGMAPEPTALATLGWLLAAPLRQRWWLALIPTAALLLGAGVLWLLYDPG